MYADTWAENKQLVDACKGLNNLMISVVSESAYNGGARISSCLLSTGCSVTVFMFMQRALTIKDTGKLVQAGC